MYKETSIIEAKINSNFLYMGYWFHYHINIILNLVDEILASIATVIFFLGLARITTTINPM